MRKLLIYTDGASRGNPGPAGIGVVICDESGKIVKEYEEFIGTATNNIAEYRALIKALELAGIFSINKIDCFSDSELMVKQLNGEYRVKNEKLGKLFLQVREKEKRFEKVNYFHVPREEDLIKRADKLANRAIDEFKMMEREREKDGWNYFVKGKELFSKSEDNLSPEHIEEIEMSFRKAIELNPKLWAPHYYLGSLFYLTGQYHEAKMEFEKALEKNTEPKYEQPIGYYLGEIKRIESGYSFPRNLEEVMEMTSDPVLLNHALIEWFENTLREVIQGVLSNVYGEDWWWDGVPSDVRKKYGERVQETRLKEERKLPELYFIDFYDYGKIIEAKTNKEVFSSYMENPKEWKRRLDDLEPIRNSIMHCRGQYLSEKRISRLKESCVELQKLVEKVNKGENTF
ncbi:MAG: reverse transcriptase-like protein [Methanophagales archaeon]|nr:reverse transcriptase-like protein [Methanophagales archaeon]